MPGLDRRITVREVVPGEPDVFGRPTDPTNVDTPVWAMLLQDRVARELIVGGTYGDSNRVWRVRYRQSFADAIAAGRTVRVIMGDIPGEDEPQPVDADFDVVTGIGEPTEGERRRYLDLLT